MELRKLFADCAETTVNKGFNVANYVAQLLLMGTEISEALEDLIAKDDQLHLLQRQFVSMMDTVEHLRRHTKWDADWEWDDSLYVDPHGVKANFLEELADLQIRLASFVGGNNITDEFIRALEKKMEVNKGRPYLHGKQN